MTGSEVGKNSRADSDGMGAKSGPDIIEVDARAKMAEEIAKGFLDRIRKVARECGYAIGVHGSLKRDLDLMAVPWTPEAVSAQVLVGELCDQLGLRERESNVYEGDKPRIEPNPEIKPWGRIGWSLDGVPAGLWKYVDLSVAPRAGEAVPVRTYIREVAP